MVVLERRVTRAAGWARRLAAFALALLLTSGISQRYGLLETPGFFVVLAIVAALALLALVSAAVAFARVWNEGDLGLGDAVFGAFLAILVLVPFGYVGYEVASLPMLADVTTDLDDPPLFAVAGAARTAAMNPLPDEISAEQARLQEEGYPSITGRRYDLPFDRTLDAVNDVVENQGWTLYPAPAESDEGELTIEAQARTAVFALPVDVAVRVIDEDGTSYVDMRSAWRYGPHDLGDDAARINAFLTELDQQISAQAGVAPASQPAQ